MATLTNDQLIKAFQLGKETEKSSQEQLMMAGSSAGRYGEGGANTPVNRETMPWLYPDDEPGTDPAEVFEQLELPLDTVKRLQELMISGGVLLPGESPAGGKGGLGSMNKDQLERWIKENGITGPGADKIRNKWKNLGPNLPLADASALTNYLKGIGQNQRTGSMRDSNLKGKELIDALKIGVEKFKA